MRTIPTALVITSALAVSGCAAVSGSPGVDARFGDRVRALTAQQIVDPAAPQRHGTAVSSTSGKLVRDTVDRMGESYRTPPAPTVVNIGVVGGQ